MMRLIAIEMRLLARQRVAWVTLLFLALACAPAVANGRALMAQQLDGRAVAAKGDPSARDRVLNVFKAGSDPADAVLAPYWLRTYAVSPAPPLADFSAGRAPFEPHAASITLRTREDTLFPRTAVDNPEAAARGSLDLGFVAIVLVPLALVGLGYGLFTADRESGAARLLLAQGGSPVRVLVARSVPRLLLALAPLVIAALVLLVSGASLDGRISAASWWLLLALALASFWWAVILLVNSFRVGAETAALALIATWALFTLVLPAAVASAAQLAYPAPSRFEQIAAGRAAEVASTTAYENDHPDLASEGFAGRLASVRKTLQIGRTVERATAPIAARFDAQLAGQQRIVRRLAWVSPPLLAADGLNAVAGTDVGRAIGFRQAAARHLTERKNILGGFIDRGALMTLNDYTGLPDFDWRPAPARPIGQIVALALLALVLGAVAVHRLGRASV